MYFEPEFKVVLVETVDVIRTSTGGNQGGNGDMALPEQELE